MTDSEVVNKLWGGRLEATWLDPCSARADLVVAVRSQDDIERFRIEAESVQEFRFLTTFSGRPWFYAEVTEALLENVSENLLRLTLILWSEESEIEILARTIEIKRQVD